LATKVVMAQLSPTMEEGRLIEWKVGVGDTVAQGDVVAEIETDKANMEVEALGSGVLRQIVVQEGETVPVGTLIGVIAEPDEDISALLAKAEAGEGMAVAVEVAEAAEVAGAAGAAEVAEAGKAAEATGAPSPGPDPGVAGSASVSEPSAASVETAAAPPAPGDGRIKASPVARKIARERGLDLASIAGSGPGGRIVKADVESALRGEPPAAPAAVPAAPTAVPTAPAEAPAAPAEAPAAPVEAPAAPTAAPAAATAAPSRPELRERVVEASQMRKAIARRLVQSIGPVPHFFLTTEVDMERALELRAALNARWPDGKIGVNDLLLKATAEALARHPEINASWETDSVHYHGRVDLGIAVAIDGGLITPVLRDADRKGLRQISGEARDLIGRARERRLKPDEYEGATFSVSNLGMFEIEEFTAIINPPEGGILAIGRTTERPVVVNGEVVVRKRMRVTMSCDHRVIDGATGAAFLETFKAMLENPLEMVL